MKAIERINLIGGMDERINIGLGPWIDVFLYWRKMDKRFVDGIGKGSECYSNWAEGSFASTSLIIT